jgi:hypothetical protein
MRCADFAGSILFMSLIEPTTIPGLDKALLELLIIFSVIAASGLIVTASSIAGIIRALRRRRRSGQSISAVVLAVVATAITTGWLLYWVGDDIYHRSNPIDALLLINLLICVPPWSWLSVAIHANVARRKG